MDTKIAHNGSIHKIHEEKIPWVTTRAPLTQEEEDAIVTLVVIVLGVIVAIIVLFSMGIFIDCRQQKHDSMMKKQMKLRKKPRRNRKEDQKYLTGNMCPNSVNDFGSTSTTDAIV